MREGTHNHTMAVPDIYKDLYKYKLGYDKTHTQQEDQWLETTGLE